MGQIISRADSSLRPSVKLVMAVSEDCLELTHACLARIRCLQECVKCLTDCIPLPEAICYVRDECPIKATKYGKVVLHTSPGSVPTEPARPCKQTGENEKVMELSVHPEDIVYVSGEEYCDNQGQWAAVQRVCLY